MGAPHRLFAAALVELERELDWGLLGDLYCEGDGRGFFDEERRDRMREAGLLFAEAVSERLAEAGGREGRSLYVGASVAELGPVLCEALFLGREVHLLGIDGPEADELNRAFAAVEDGIGARLPRLSSTAPAGPFDHLWLVSVLTDPDAFPALHDHLYERAGTPEATGRGELDEDRARAGALVRDLLARLAPPAVFTTTDEERGFADEWVRAAGLVLEPGPAIVNAVVGDRVELLLARRR